MSFGLAASRGAAAYSAVGVETGVSTADPHKLILMLFEGALLQVGTAVIALEKKDIPAKGSAISKAIEIILNGLKVSLDYEAGGDLAERLGALALGRHRAGGVLLSTSATVPADRASLQRPDLLGQRRPEPQVEPGGLAAQGAGTGGRRFLADEGRGTRAQQGAFFDSIGR